MNSYVHPNGHEWVRVCLNSNGYIRPSGGEKAHSKNRAGANSHRLGCGLEEWLCSPLLRFQGKALNDLGIKDVECDAEYQVGYIEAFKLDNYLMPVPGRKDLPRDAWRELYLLTNTAPGEWHKVATIKRLRGLLKGEITALHSDMASRGVLTLMNGEVQTYPRKTLSISTLCAQEVISCLFKVEDWLPDFSREIVLQGHNRYKNRYYL